jgi:hypothetical protein
VLRNEAHLWCAEERIIATGWTGKGVKSLPFFHQWIDFLAMTDAEDEDFVAIDPEHNAVITGSKFPIAFEGLPQGFTIFMRGNHEACFNGLFDPLPDIGVELRNIPPLNVRMIND